MGIEKHFNGKSYIGNRYCYDLDREVLTIYEEGKKLVDIRYVKEVDAEKIFKEVVYELKGVLVY